MLPSTPSPPPGPQREMKVLALGLPRTGSTSIAEALTILGYKDVYHCTKAINSPRDWQILGRAADATFPCLPSYTGVPFTRHDWDELYAPCEGTTDAASMFGPSLLAAYPEAKVLLVERDYERWHASIFNSLLPIMWSPLASFSVRYVEPLIGSVAGQTSRKMILGLLSASSVEECRANAREAYLNHGRQIRELVPPERLLVYHMGEGWGPLCEFLGKEVPDKEFPWLNEATVLRKIAMDITLKNMAKAMGVVLPWVVGLGAAATGLWMVLRR